MISPNLSKEYNSEVLTMDKTIQFVFADTKLKAFDCFDDIWQAARFTQHNLYYRHGIVINRPIVTENNFVTMTMRVPNHLISSFSTGRHLRGISAYLLRKHPDKYKPHLVGTRLLYYVEVQSKEV